MRIVLVDPNKTGMNLALLYVPTKNLPVVRFGDSRSLKVGEAVLDFGNPQGVYGVPEHGIVAVPEERTYEAPAWRRLYAFSMPSFSGMSGSSVLNARGQLVAVLKGGTGENFTVGIPSHVVKDWLRGNGFELK